MSLKTYLSADQQNLLDDTQKLLTEIKSGDLTYSDYSFLVFPAAKLYEGFLKKFFLDLGIISYEQYSSDRFRIGKVLNPNLEHEHRHESVYDRLSEIVGREFSEELWQLWKRGRNRIFHYWPNNTNNLTLKESEEIIRELIKGMEEALYRLRS